ncbi:MAG: pantoate--beta-alanine ligase, partial [bacterium]|nr:pantoate--beta-alanine ligase [bacterium]
MEIVHDAFDMQARCTALKREGKRIALVPTMGWLHEGHLSLLREGRKRADVLALSVFVNPLQFGAGEDFDAYPRNLMRDAALAEKTGADLLFAPQREALYPADFSTHVEVSGLT